MRLFRQTGSQWLADHATLVFWVCFATLNFLLFLPLALLDGDSVALTPEVTPGAGPWLALNQLFVWRTSLDPLRVSVELVVAVALWVNVRFLRKRPIAWLIVLLYALALAYSIYEAVMLSIYRTAPVFYSHYFLARDGLPFLLEHAGAAPAFYVLALAGALAATAAVIGLVLAMLASGARLGRFSRFLPAAIGVLCVAAALGFQAYTAQPEMVPSSLAWKLEQNIAASLSLQQEIATFNDSDLQVVHNYRNYQLEHRPDIYLIFVESYGSVLYKRPDFKAAYTSLLDELQEQLRAGGWQAASALSGSTTWGGGSWMAYTSFLFGLRIDNQPQYLALRDRYQTVDYPDLGSALQRQGYFYAWVSSLEENLSDKAWSKYENFLGPDRWLRFKDLQYQGPLYGWGPAPPDQYVLHYANELLQAGTEQPLFYVTITQNSHYPWDLPPALLGDWRDFNQMPAQVTTTGDDLAHDDKRQRYLAAIEYELRMLVDFVEKTGDEDTIFILVGDHQPPQVSRRADGWETPVHIIAKDAALLAALGDYGFTPGLQVDVNNPSLQHEGMYSLLMSVLLDRYGSSHVAGPGYWTDEAN